VHETLKLKIDFPQKLTQCPGKRIGLIYKLAWSCGKTSLGQTY